MNSAVERAIKFICDRYDEPLSLSDAANSAILSRFHFSRVFKDATGVTPGRFLSAVRIYEAKRMLLNTEMNVTEIAFAVGYNSLGSFSNHFADSVGISPGRFRRMAQDRRFKIPRPRQEFSAQGTVAGHVAFPRGYGHGQVYVGAFDTPIVQRQPGAAVSIGGHPGAEPSRFRLTGVPEGTWFVNAVAVADNTEPEPWTRRTLLVGRAGPVTVSDDAVVSVRIELHAKLPTDLPILRVLPELEAWQEEAWQEDAMPAEDSPAGRAVPASP
jgi:AraC family transcriptional regulator